MVNIGLIAGVAIIGALFTFCILFYIHLKRNDHDYDSPVHQIKQLKKATQEFGVKYDELVFGKLLGKGSQGEVFRATWRGSNVAVKKVDTRKVPPEIIEEFCQEAEIMRRLRHPSLTLFMGVSLEHPHLCIVTEIVARGSLFDIIHDEASPMTWVKCLGIALDVATGMTYLHSHNPPILHRDLKSLNILVDENWRAKVADFGMTRFQEDGTMTQCGSPLWMAPEMIKNDPYDEKSDVYSFGICMWELYTRKIPYRDLGLNPSHLVVKVVKENLRPPIPKQCPRAYAKLMERCWHPQAEKRPSFKQMLKVLEGFTTDPLILNHKPMSDRENIHAADQMEEELPIDIQAATQTIRAWKLDRVDVELLDLKKEEEKKNAEKKEKEKLTEKKEKEKKKDSKDSPKEGKDSPKDDKKQRKSIKKDEKDKSPKKDKKKEEKDDDKPSLLASPSLGRALTITEQNNLELQNTLPVDQGEGVAIGKFRGKQVAIKTCIIDMKLTTMTAEEKVQADLADDRDGDRVSSFLKTLGNMRHPNLVLFMGAFYDIDHIGVVQEYMPRGTLQNVLLDAHFVLDWDTCLQLLIDAAHGMSYLHGAKPPHVHEDLNASRLLVDKNWRLKIADYAFVDLQATLTKQHLPPSIWSAVEVIKDPKNLTPAANVYSFAMIMYAVLCRKTPFDGVPLTKALSDMIVRKEFRPHLPTSLSAEIRSLIESCWHTDPLKRPDFTIISETLQKQKTAGPPKVELIVGQNAFTYRKAKTVYAYRSKDAVTIMKDWGKNIGKSGTIVIFSGEDDVYLCDPEVFSSTYEAVGPADHNEYRKTGIVVAKQMAEAFAVKTNGGIEHGMSGDFLIQNETGDQWSVESKTFLELYEKCEEPVKVTAS